MTTSVAYHKPGVGTFIGSDSKYTTPREYYFGGKKFLRSGKTAICYSGMLTTLSLIEERLDLSKITNPTNFRDAMEALCKRHNYDLHKDPDCPVPYYGFDIILVNNKNIWEIGADFSVRKVNPNTLSVVGSGSDYALGAAYNLKDKEPLQIVTQAIKTASQFDNMTGGRIWTDLISVE